MDCLRDPKAVPFFSKKERNASLENNGYLGVNLYGYFRAESGVGEHVRTLLRVFDAAEIPAVPIDFGFTRSRKQMLLPFGTATVGPFSLHLICINADQTPSFFASGPSPLCGTRIGYWHWEVEEFPDWMAEASCHLDEVWTASRHSQAAIARKVKIPVRVLPPAIAPPEPEPLPETFCFPGSGPLVLSCFDFDSVVARKNPAGSLEAFCLAFPRPGMARLLVKSINGHHHPQALADLKERFRARPDTLLIDGYLTRAQQSNLIASCDIFLSLHRAEGFGLMLGEAMYFGKPVVATGYSGNLEFQNEETALLIPWKPTPIPPGCGPYSGSWAEPDLEKAAAALRFLASDRPENRRQVTALAERARRSILEQHSIAARRQTLRTLLQGAQEKRNTESMEPRSSPPPFSRSAPLPSDSLAVS
jgi:hypothetical protein